MVLIHQRHRWTDGRTTCNLNTALCSSASRGKKDNGLLKPQDKERILFNNEIYEGVEKETICWIKCARRESRNVKTAVFFAYLFVASPPSERLANTELKQTNVHENGRGRRAARRRCACLVCGSSSLEG